jgi:hypothetical protein
VRAKAAEAAIAEASRLAARRQTRGCERGDHVDVGDRVAQASSRLPTAWIQVLATSVRRKDRQERRNGDPQPGFEALRAVARRDRPRNAENGPRPHGAARGFRSRHAWSPFGCPLRPIRRTCRISRIGSNKRAADALSSLGRKRGGECRRLCHGSTVRVSIIDCLESSGFIPTSSRDGSLHDVADVGGERRLPGDPAKGVPCLIAPAFFMSSRCRTR